VLDDATTKSLFVDVDPAQRGSGSVGGAGGGRVFRMSFDARRYDPADVSVRCEDDGRCLVVEAKHQELDGATGTKVSAHTMHLSCF